MAPRALTEHLGLIPPQNATSGRVTLSMRPAPVPNEDETCLEDDARVADPLCDEFQNLLNSTARVNREVFTELFRPVPSNLVHNWAAYEVRRGLVHFLDVLAETGIVQVYKPKVKVGHVAPKIPLQRVKDRLACVRGSIVEAPLVRFLYYLVSTQVLIEKSQDFLIDEKDFCEGPDWRGLNPTLPIYI